MSKRKKYQDIVARMLYDHTAINTMAITIQNSWKEADAVLSSVEKRLKAKKDENKK